jgi:hypothetical protein
MATLSAGARRSLPKSEFGEPGARKYPMPDKSHAQVAKGRATQQVKKGKLSPAAASRIRAKADRILGKGKKLGIAASSDRSAAIGAPVKAQTDEYDD